MKEYRVQVAVIGGGPAGLSAALAAREQGAESVLILERNPFLGGILNQCIHPGFGLTYFNEELTGPEYAWRFIQQVQREEGIEVWTDTMVLSITEDKTITAVGKKRGYTRICTQAIVLAMGCRERPRGVLLIPGDRPSGIYSAGTAQEMVNLRGWVPGKDVVVLGSGDIGLIMARRMHLEGARVHGVYEMLPYSSGLKRNMVQCLYDFHIPLCLSTTVVEIHGKSHLQGVTVARVDEGFHPIPGTERTIPCDTLLLSVGLIPENELSRHLAVRMNPATQGPMVDNRLMTSVPGIYAAGNALHVHDVVDYVTQEAALAGASAARPVPSDGGFLSIHPGEGVRYTLPNTAQVGQKVLIRFRVKKPSGRSLIRVVQGSREIFSQWKQQMTPGEMEDVEITPRTLEPIFIHAGGEGT